MTRFFGNASQLSKFCMICVIGLAFTVKSLHDHEATLIQRIEECHLERLKELREILEGNKQANELYQKATEKVKELKSENAFEESGCCGETEIAAVPLTE